MAEATRFVHIVDDVPELEGRKDGPVLIHALDGFLDAGNAANLAAKHLQSDSNGRVVASFSGQSVPSRHGVHLPHDSWR